MKTTLTTLALAAATVITPAHAADKIKVGLLSTLSGAGAGLGVDIRDGFQLAMKHQNGKIGDIPADIIVADDQMNPDAAKQTAERMIKRDKVHFMTGTVFSNIMLAIGPAAFQNKTFFISANAGPSQYAGKQCNPYFFSASYQNDSMHETVGQTVQDKGFKKVALLAPNYPAGKDALTGFKRYYKGDIALESYTPLSQLDYGAELSKIRASGADALYIFLPGGMGVNFIKQFHGAALNKEMTLFAPGFSADEDVISAVGEAMLGIFNSSQWAHDMDNAANQKFVADFEKEYGRLPSMYAAQGYDTARLMDAAVREIKGKVEDKAALRKALETVQFDSVRGPWTFGKNHYPVQNYYLREIIKDDKGRITNKMVSRVFENYTDAWAGECQMK